MNSFPNSKMVAATVIEDDQITVSWGLIFAKHNAETLTQILRFKLIQTYKVIQLLSTI